MWVQGFISLARCLDRGHARLICIDCKAADARRNRYLFRRNRADCHWPHEIRGSADSIRNAAKEASAGNANLSQRTEEQASTLEETVSSMEGLTSAVRENTASADDANALARAANKVTAQGGIVVSAVVTTMSEIQESSKKISDIISVIDGIAF